MNKESEWCVHCIIDKNSLAPYPRQFLHTVGANFMEWVK